MMSEYITAYTTNELVNSGIPATEAQQHLATAALGQEVSIELINAEWLPGTTSEGLDKYFQARSNHKDITTQFMVANYGTPVSVHHSISAAHLAWFGPKTHPAELARKSNISTITTERQTDDGQTVTVNNIWQTNYRTPNGRHLPLALVLSIDNDAAAQLTARNPHAIHIAERMVILAELSVSPNRA